MAYWLLRHAAELGEYASTPAEKLAVQRFRRDMLRDGSRAEALQIVGAMAPQIVAQGGDPAVEECIAAIQDLSRWWP